MRYNEYNLSTLDSRHWLAQNGDDTGPQDSDPPEQE